MSIQLWLDLRREMRTLVDEAMGEEGDPGSPYARDYPREQFEKVLDAIEAIAAEAMGNGQKLNEGAYERGYTNGYADASRFLT